MKIITLCGSTKFKETFEEVTRKLTLRGYVVLGVGLYIHADNESLHPYTKQMLDVIHLRKILLSDAIYVINVDGYIGNSTKFEMEFANQLGKKIYYLERMTNKAATC